MSAGFELQFAPIAVRDAIGAADGGELIRTARAAADAAATLWHAFAAVRADSASAHAVGSYSQIISQFMHYINVFKQEAENGTILIAGWKSTKYARIVHVPERIH